TVLTVSVGAQSSDDHTRVIVRFKKDVSDADRDKAVKEKNSKKDEEVYADHDLWVVESKEGKKDKELAADFKKDKRTVYAEPDLELHTMALSSPNDALFSQEYARQRINSVAGWSLYPDAYTEAGGAKVAMVETGIDTYHPDI